MPIAQTPNYLTGQVVAAYFGGNALYCMGGSLDESVVVVKATNSRSGGFQEVRPGITSISGSTDLIYNGDSPITIRSGSFGVFIFNTVGYEFSENQENITPGTGGGAGTPTTPTGEIVTFNAMVEKVSRSWTVDGDLKYSISYQSSSPITYTTGTGATPLTAPRPEAQPPVAEDFALPGRIVNPHAPATQTV